MTALCGVFLTLSFIPNWGALALISVALGSPFALDMAWRSLRLRALDVNMLMVIAATGSITVGREQDAAVLLFLFSLSTSLENLAMIRTKSAIEHLVRLRPTRAMRERGEAVEWVPVEHLLVGDTIRVPAYESIPTDGEIVEGLSSVDASAMTGEAQPVPCAPGSSVTGGTQNLDGALRIRVTAVIGDSALDRIVDLVRDAQDNKASGERVSQWFGQRYTLFVLAAFAVSLIVRLALGELAASAFYESLTLLVGLSPCALVISTPATTLSALTWCARNGILVRGGVFIERAGNVRIVALDKTGTLTEGRPSLRRMALVLKAAPDDVLNWWSGEELGAEAAETLGLAAAAEGGATHPLAIAVVRAAGGQVSASEQRMVPGLGVTAKVGDDVVWVGREGLLAEQGIEVPSALRQAMAEMRAEGMTVSLVAHRAAVAAFAFSDSLREGSSSFVSELRALGIRRVVMLTGDRAETAEAVAKSVGLDAVLAGLMPGGKTDEIARLGKEGEVMMIGDGVNDAPSLAGASIGVAMGGLGSDVALNAADVVLMRDRLQSVVDLIRLGRMTTATIRFNLVFAGSVIAGLAFASLTGRLPLPIAVVGHEGSTVLVILNGLRMLRGPRR